jgi:hypothetical protein
MGEKYDGVSLNPTERRNQRAKGPTQLWCAGALDLPSHCPVLPSRKETGCRSARAALLSASQGTWPESPGASLPKLTCTNAIKRALLS